jgi:hypothetical protein
MGRGKPSFSLWLYRQRGRQDPVGDLARDVRDDPYWPKAAMYREYRAYLVHHDASRDCLAALKRARDEWQQAAQTGNSARLAA